MKNFFVYYKNPVTIILLMMLAAGVFVYTRIPTALFPDITFPKIKVIADNGEQPVDKMMITVTKPLENAIKQVPALKMIRSTTSQGSAEISAFMDWNADIDLSKQQVESRIAEISNMLPPNTQITVEKMNPSILPVMGYSLESTNKSKIELKLIADYTIKPFLSRVDGISAIRVIGGKTKEYQVILHPDKLSTLSLTPDTIVSMLNQANFITSDGYLTDYNRLYLTLTDATVDSKEDLENTIIINNPQRAIRIKDIATVKINERREYVYINANGQNVPLIAVIKQPNANLVTVAHDVQAQVAQLNQLLPQGVRLRPYYNQADFVNTSVKSITDVLWIGLALAIVVAIIFLRSWKASTVILITIPITLALTLVTIYALGYTFNIMTLGAIAAAIGLIIDDAIVVVEQIHRTHEEHPDEATPQLIGKAVHFLLPAMIGSSLSTIVIFIPFVLMSGVAGAYFSVMTNTMIVTLICSFFVTWLGLPVVYLLLSGKENKLGKKDAHQVTRQPWVNFFIHKPVISIVFSLLLAGSIYFIYPLLPTGFLPELDEGSIVLDYNSPPGTSLQETNRMLNQVDQILGQTPEVASFSRRTGTQMGFFITEPNRGDYLIQLKDQRTRTTEEVSDDIRQHIEATLPALVVDFGQVIGDMLGDLMTSAQPIEIKIFGDDQQQLRQLAQQVAGVVEQVPGTADVFNGITIAGPRINVAPDFAKLAQFQISPNSFQQQLQAQIGGVVIGGILEKEQMTDIRMLYPRSDSLSVEALSGASLFLPSGQRKPIRQLATITLQEGVAEIERENLQSVDIVTARLNNRDLGSVVKDIQQKIATQVHLPSGYQIVYGGSYAQQQQSFQELLLILVLASLLVFTVILFLFRDFKVALLIISIAVLGAAGSLWALLITHTPLNVGSYTGVIMIVGIIGENAIFTLTQYFDSITNVSRDEAIVYAISTRLRPKLMTALGAIIALMPLALGIGTGAQMHQPLAIAVIGGFVVALPLLLIVLPSMLRLVYRKQNV